MWADTHRAARVILPGILLLCWLLLNADLEGKSLWADELFTADVVNLPAQDLIRQTADDFHPPLYFMLVKLWTATAGRSDFALRWPSVVAGWLSLAVLVRLARQWADRRTALVCAGLWGLSPALILYARMARYYAPTTLAALLATLLLWRATRHDPGARSGRFARWPDWLAYVIASWTAVLTFYLGGLLLLAHGIFVLLVGGWRQLRPWLASLLGVGVLMLPWAGVIANQTVRTGSGATDLAFGLPGFALKLAYTAYALALGESLFPWRPLAVAGLVCVLALFVAGVLGWHRRRLALPLLGLLVLPLVAMMWLIAIVTPRTPFISVPARGLFAAPFFALILAGAAGRLRPRFLVPCLAVVAAAWGATLWNYYHDADFLNPIYLTPSKQMVQFVEPQLQPGDIVFSDRDSGFAYYYRQTRAQIPSFTDVQAATAYLEGDRVARVWVVTLGRDQSAHSVTGAVTLSRWLDEHYACADSWGFVPQDETYRELKSALLGRPAYAYRARVSLYVQ